MIDKNEWQTPGIYVKSARSVLGDIDIDPASNTNAQKTICARQFYTMSDDGLCKDWNGRIWINPPYSSGKIEPFADKLINEVQSGRAESFIVLTNSACETGWWRKFLSVSDAVCFPNHRIKFLRPDGKTGDAPRYGQSFFYKGDNVASFKQEFSQYGNILLPCV